jgi:hypothetical protein
VLRPPTEEAHEWLRVLFGVPVLFGAAMLSVMGKHGFAWWPAVGAAAGILLGVVLLGPLPGGDGCD